MINLQNHIRGNNINQGFNYWCRKLGVRFEHIKVKCEQCTYYAKAMHPREIEKFIRKGRELAIKYPRLNSETEAGLLSQIKILEQALKQYQDANTKDTK